MRASSKFTSQLLVDVLTLCGVEQNSVHITTCRLLFSSSSRQWRTVFDFHWAIAESPVTWINPQGRRWACENLPKEISRYFTFRHKVVLWKNTYISFKNFSFSDFYWKYGFLINITGIIDCEKKNSVCYYFTVEVKSPLQVDWHNYKKKTSNIIDKIEFA